MWGYYTNSEMCISCHELLLFSKSLFFFFSFLFQMHGSKLPKEETQVKE